MKLNYTIEELEHLGFSVKVGTISNEDCFLVVPKLATNPDIWNKDTLIFRSSIWNKSGELVSASFKKFFNIFESSDVVRDPTDVDFSDMKIVEKKDGSTLIVSKVNGELIHRTRGTFNAENLPNGQEISFLKQKYPLVFDNVWINDCNMSLLFEWTTPTNKIVIDYGSEPELTLIGAVRHDDYYMIKQSTLDGMAKDLGVKRPKIYTYSNIDELISSVNGFTGEEGVVIYFNDEQDMKKVKGLEYLKLHRFKSNATIKNTVEMFFELGFKSIGEYKEYIKTQFDFECLSLVEIHIAKVFNYYFKARNLIDDLRLEVSPLKALSRKDAALEILSKHKSDGLSGYCFELLSEKEIPVDKVKALVYSLLEKDGELK